MNTIQRAHASTVPASRSRPLNESLLLTKIENQLSNPSQHPHLSTHPLRLGILATVLDGLVGGATDPSAKSRYRDERDSGIGLSESPMRSLFERAIITPTQVNVDLEHKLNDNPVAPSPSGVQLHFRVELAMPDIKCGPVGIVIGYAQNEKEKLYGKTLYNEADSNNAPAYMAAFRERSGYAQQPAHYLNFAEAKEVFSRLHPYSTDIERHLTDYFDSLLRACNMQRQSAPDRKPDNRVQYAAPAPNTGLFHWDRVCVPDSHASLTEASWNLAVMRGHDESRLYRGPTLRDIIQAKIGPKVDNHSGWRVLLAGKAPSSARSTHPHIVVDKRVSDKVRELRNQTNTREPLTMDDLGDLPIGQLAEVNGVVQTWMSGTLLTNINALFGIDLLPEDLYAPIVSQEQLEKIVSGGAVSLSDLFGKKNVPGKQVTRYAPSFIGELSAVGITTILQLARLRIDYANGTILYASNGLWIPVPGINNYHKTRQFIQTYAGDL